MAAERRAESTRGAVADASLAYELAAFGIQAKPCRDRYVRSAAISGGTRCGGPGSIGAWHERLVARRDAVSVIAAAAPPDILLFNGSGTSPNDIATLEDVLPGNGQALTCA